jgi:hypothetical protein
LSEVGGVSLQVESSGADVDAAVATVASELVAIEDGLAGGMQDFGLH